MFFISSVRFFSMMYSTPSLPGAEFLLIMFKALVNSSYLNFPFSGDSCFSSWVYLPFFSSKAYGGANLLILLWISSSLFLFIQLPLYVFPYILIDSHFVPHICQVRKSINRCAESIKTFSFFLLIVLSAIALHFLYSTNECRLFSLIKVAKGMAAFLCSIASLHSWSHYSLGCPLFIVFMFFESFVFFVHIIWIFARDP